MESIEIFKRLPHRYPFCLIDRVKEIKLTADPLRRLGRKAVVIKNVTISEPYFEGHFPGNPVMPGVLQVEAAAQSCAICACRDGDPPQDFAIVGIDNAKFRRPVIPGDVLEINVEIIKEKGKILVFQCAGFVEGQLANEMTLTAYVAERKS
ncbi:MAG: 3-hydroxyacyl-ACP dehydratase FabZ [Pseudomonadota bacterium]|nr:3-hydroxyacyl-ACP dehydratase FabZ [Pseudomonadota bacterium]